MTQPTEDLYSEELYLIPEKTTVILSEPWTSIEDPERELLQKILGAVRLKPEGVVIIHQPGLDLASLGNSPEKVIYFGEPVKGLTPFEVITSQKTSVILAPTLKSLQSDPNGKQKLWAALKQLFGL